MGNQEPNSSPFHMGMRIYKTGLAAFICLIFSKGLGGYPFFAVIAALICMKPTFEDSLKVGLHRVLGTIIGGVAGMVLLAVVTAAGIQQKDLLYDALVALVIMLLIKLIVSLNRSPSTVITCVTFCSILLMPLGQLSIVQYSLMRILDTLLGVFVALIINEVLPKHRLSAQEAADLEAKLEEQIEAQIVETMDQTMVDDLRRANEQNRQVPSEEAPQPVQEERKNGS